MGETPSTFHPSFNAGVGIEARIERLTSDAGAVIVREVMERSGIIEWLTERLHDPRQPHLLIPDPGDQRGCCPGTAAALVLKGDQAIVPNRSAGAGMTYPLADLLRTM